MIPILLIHPGTIVALTVSVVLFFIGIYVMRINRKARHDEWKHRSMNADIALTSERRKHLQEKYGDDMALRILRQEQIIDSKGTPNIEAADYFTEAGPHLLVYDNMEYLLIENGLLTQIFINDEVEGFYNFTSS